MPKQTQRHSMVALAIAALRTADPTGAARSRFTLQGRTDSGPMPAAAFSGSCAYATNAATPGFNGDIALGVRPDIHPG